MPDIGSFEYGYDREGVNKYIEDIKATALQEASKALQNISAIKNCCDENWRGKAKDNFVSNLEQDSNYVAVQFFKLYSNLVSEIESVNAAMANKDEELVKKDAGGLFGGLRGW